MMISSFKGDKMHKTHNTISSININSFNINKKNRICKVIACCYSNNNKIYCNSSSNHNSNIISSRTRHNKIYKIIQHNSQQRRHSKIVHHKSNKSWTKSTRLKALYTNRNQILKGNSIYKENSRYRMNSKMD